MRNINIIARDQFYWSGHRVKFMLKNIIPLTECCSLTRQAVKHPAALHSLLCLPVWLGGNWKKHRTCRLIYIYIYIYLYTQNKWCTFTRDCLPLANQCPASPGATAAPHANSSYFYFFLTWCHTVLSSPLVSLYHLSLFCPLSAPFVPSHTSFW